MRQYFLILSAFLRMGVLSQLQFRGSLAVQAAGTFLLTGLEYLATLALLHRFGNLKGWTMAEISLLVGVVLIAFRIADALSHGLEDVGMKVKQGTFDRYFLRPVPIFLQLLGERITLRRLGGMVQGVVAMAVGLSLRPDFLTAGNLLFFAYCALCGSFFFLGLFAVRAAVSIWVVDGIEFMNIFIHGGRDLMQYPGTVYPPWVRRILIYAIPYLCLAYLPITARLGLAEARAEWIFAPLLGIVFFCICLMVFSQALRRFQSAGS